MKQTDALAIFSRLSKKYGAEPLLVQGAGGNVSVKMDDGQMVVKASGVALKKVGELAGWVGLPFEKVCQLVHSGRDCSELDPAIDDWLVGEIDKLTLTPGGIAKASIEAAMHAVLGRVVVHVHPVEINAFLCAENGQKLCRAVFGFLPFVWIRAFPPGYYLAKAIHEEIGKAGTTLPSVIFLASHGVIVHGDSETEVNQKYDQILTAARTWLLDKGIRKQDLTLENWESEISERDIFPDTVVFHKLAGNLSSVAPEKQWGIVETFAASKMIREIHQKLGVRSEFLTSDICEYILGMSREKHRQAEAEKKS